MRIFIRSSLAVVTGLFVLALASGARAEDKFPERPVRLVVSYAAGNITDVLARLVAEKLTERWKQPVIVENRPGQGGSRGAQTVVKMPADGHTLLFSALAAMAINPHLYQNLGYDPNRDFVPIIAVARASKGVLYVNPDLGVKSLAELLERGRRAGANLNYGTAGNGTVPHLNMEMLKQLTGFQATHVPYKSAVAVMNDVIGGQIQVASESLGVVLPQIRAGRIVALATTDIQRLPELPELPTITEVVPGFSPVRPWLGVLAPAGLPDAVRTEIHGAIDAALRDPKVVEAITTAGMTVMGSSSAEFAQMIAEDHGRLGKLVKALDLKVD